MATREMSMRDIPKSFCELSRPDSEPSRTGCLIIEP
jgi:hypothetical protein